MIKVRFAPSPTGYLHIGSARTALFNWLFARHNKGRFFLRVEDTDLERSKGEFLDEILDSLRWLGMDWDGELLHQSERLSIYTKKAKELLDAGLAYEQEGQIRDKDGNITKDSARIKQKAIIFKVPKGRKIAFDDLVHGKIEVESDIIKDQVMIKSDGFPAYNFACAVDDIDMGITHVIRGDDHVSNTPKQILFYEAMKAKTPEFGHVPLILGRDKSRMSKRHGATSIREYRDQGYLSSALVNFITLLGWSPGDDKEIMPLSEIIKRFGLKGIKGANAVFDVEKLGWMNGQYINQMKGEEFLEFLLPELKKRGWINEAMDKKQLIKIADMFKERVRTINDFFAQSGYVFTDEVKYDDKAVKKRLKKEGAAEVLKGARDAFTALGDFNAGATEEAVRLLAEKMNLKAAAIIHPVRVAVSGTMAGPGLFELLEVLGKEKVLKRLEASKELL